jgi:hypothetical protein
MSTVKSEIRINAEKQKVWETVANFGGIYQWNPGVKQSYSTSENNGGLGSSRHCDLETGNYLKERITDWQELQSFKLEIYESDTPIEYSEVTFSVEQEDSQTLVIAMTTYKLKYGPIGKLMDKMVVKKRIQQAFDSLLGGLRHHVETGEEVSLESFKDLQEQALQTT